MIMERVHSPIDTHSWNTREGGVGWGGVWD